MSKIQTGIQDFYNQIINGEFNTYDQLAGVVRRITQLIPELDLNSGAGINNYTQKELEQIVENFIVYVQKEQINNNYKKELYPEKNYDKKVYNTQQWQNRFQQYYKEKVNDLIHLPKVLGVGNNHEQQYQKIFKCLQTLGLYERFIYDAKRHEFQDVTQPNPSGTAGKKLTPFLFKKIIEDKINDGTIHSQVKDTPEYKYFLNLQKTIHNQKKQKKLNKYIEKDIIPKSKPSVNDISKKIFNKFKQLKNLSQTTRYDVNGNLIQSKKYQNIKNELERPEDQELLHRFKPIQNKYRDIQVLDKKNLIQQNIREQNQGLLSENLLKKLPYIPLETQKKNLPQTLIGSENRQYLDYNKSNHFTFSTAQNAQNTENRLSEIIRSKGYNAKF